MQTSKTIRIAITGPESTGKSTLAEQLGIHYQAPWVAEYAREYLNEYGPQYSYNDILIIAQQQMKNEDTAAIDQKIVFVDTELLVTKIWCEVKYNQCHPWILNELGQRQYDLVLLCNTDLPWENDALREHPDKREFLMNIYRRQIAMFYNNVEEVSGLGIERLNAAIKAVDQTIAHLAKGTI